MHASCRCSIAAGSLTALLGSLVFQWASDISIAQQDADTPKLKPLYFGASACRGCHEKVPENETEDPPVTCACNEFSIWHGQDKHKIAYRVLTEPRAKRMGELMGNKDVLNSETGCIACHGLDVPRDLQGKGFLIEDGVSCVVCHGAYENWVRDHQFNVGRKEWRSWTREQKSERFGMTDLWNPIIRTETCASCHIGNAAQKKFVTHDMYAAGHPPLPSFEIAAFSEQMPKHWEYINKKDPKVQSALKFKAGSEAFERTKLVAVSSLLTLATAMEVLHQHALESAPGSANVRAPGLDFSHFDCYACHHDLKAKSWRQERGYFGKPGRPQMHPWPTVLAEICLCELEDDKSVSDEFRTQLRQLYDGFDEQPFGKVERIASSAGNLSKILSKSARKLATMETPKYQEKALGLLRAMVNYSDMRIPDYDSARQIAWAIDSIVYELQAAGSTQVSVGVADVLGELKKDLKLKLPAGQNEDILKELNTSLQQLNNYDPKVFREHMKKLSKLLPSS